MVIVGVLSELKAVTRFGQFDLKNFADGGGRPIGHHDNAILSRYPITDSENDDVSSHTYEPRGLPHREIDFPIGRILHCICAHLGLHERARRQQIGALIERVEREVPPAAPLIIAGDFNDWRDLAGARLTAALGMNEAFHFYYGKPARSFSSAVPLVRIDRIYVRGFAVPGAKVHHGLPWSRISEHAVQSAQVVLE